jgi:hypothetical protein
MLFRDVLKNSLISLLCFYLAITHGYALPTAENSSFLLTRDYGLSTWTDAGVEIDVYPEPNSRRKSYLCNGLLAWRYERTFKFPILRDISGFEGSREAGPQ